MPSTHTNPVRHICTWNLIGCHFLRWIICLTGCRDTLFLLLVDGCIDFRGQINWANQSFVLVKPWYSGLLASFIHKFNVNCRIHSSLEINYMSMGMVATGEHHPRIWGHLQVKLIKNPLVLIDFAQFLIQVLGHVESLHRLLVIPYIPNLHRKVVTTKYVVVTGGCKLGFRNWINYLCEKVLSGGILTILKLGWVLVELAAYSEVAIADAALTGWKEENVRPLRMIFHKSYHLWKFFHFWRLQIDQVESNNIILYIP